MSPLPKLGEPIGLSRNQEDQRWAEELEAEAERFRSSSRWQTSFRTLLERLSKDRQKTLEDELAMARSENPDHFLILLKILTDQHYLSRTEVRSFIDSKYPLITPTAFRNALHTYRRVFLDRKTRPRQK